MWTEKLEDLDETSLAYCSERCLSAHNTNTRIIETWRVQSFVMVADVEARQRPVPVHLHH